MTVVAGIGGWALSQSSRQARNIWRLDHMEAEMAEIQQVLKELRKSQAGNELNMQVLEVNLRQIKEILGDIRTDLRGKADKTDRVD